MASHTFSLASGVSSNKPTIEIAIGDAGNVWQITSPVGPLLVTQTSSPRTCSPSMAKLFQHPESVESLFVILGIDFGVVVPADLAVWSTMTELQELTDLPGRCIPGNLVLS